MTEAKGVEVSVVLPAYNEAGAVGRVVGEIGRLYPDFEILVVDDGSTDGTGQEALAAGARVVTHAYNRGNGAAVKTGIRSARGRFLVLMDADGQHDPAEIPGLLAGLDRFEMVVGARDFKKQGAWHRSLANRLYSRFATYLAGQRVRDLTSGFRAIRREVALRFAYLLPNTFSYPSTITLAMFKAGYGVSYQPITAARRIGRSKIRLFRDGARFLAIMIKIVTLFNPMKVFFPLGLLFFVPGLAYTLFRLLTGHRLSNPMVLSLSVACLIFALGLISEQIALLRLEHIDQPLTDSGQEENEDSA